MIIKTIAGLCNRLRVILSWRKYCIAHNTPCKILWELEEACNGYFSDYFQPIPDVEFIDSLQNNQKIDVETYNINEDFNLTNEDFKLLKPKNEIQQILDSELNKLSNQDFIAVHIRRTDLKNHLYKKGFDFNMLNSIIISFINNHDNKLIYCASDNRLDYLKLRKKYNNRFFQQKPKFIIRSFRKTELKQAVIDLFMCTLATNFQGTPESSFSEMIINIRQANAISG